MSATTTWIDISELKGWNGHFTGIQRVVFNISKELRANPNLNIRLCRFDYRRKAFIETDYGFEEPSYEVTKTGKVKKTFTQKATGRIKGAIPTSVKKTLKSVISYTSPPYISLHKKVSFKKGDTLFIAGAFWTGQLKGATKVKQKIDINITSILYDMVPVIMPQLCTRVTEIDFNREVKKAVRMVDTWICISENTKKDLINYANVKKLKMNAKNISVIRLGSDINTEGRVASPFTKKNDPGTFLLFVSTIEARKNQQLVYQTIKLAEKRGIVLPPIVLVGKHGWHSDDIASILKRDKTIKKKLIWLENADDSKLRWLYKNCLFTIYPSLYEGWGLPVAESIAYGKLSLASDVSSIPEVAGDLIDYFSPYDPRDFLAKIQKYTAKTDQLHQKEFKLKTFHQPSWKEIVKDLESLFSNR